MMLMGCKATFQRERLSGGFYKLVGDRLYVILLTMIGNNKDTIIMSFVEKNYVSLLIKDKINVDQGKDCN